MVTGQPWYVAALCAGAAAWFCAGGGAHRRHLVLPGGGVSVAARGRTRRCGAVRRWPALGPRLRARARPEWLCLAAALVLAVLGESPLPLFAGVVAVPLAGRQLRARARRRDRVRREEAVIDLCGVVAAELRAGSQPGQALRFAADATGALGADEAAVLAAARFGGDVAEALRVAARADGAEGLAGLAACWQVAVDGGAGLATGLDRLESALRDRRDQRERLRAHLSGSWTTVVLLAVLPLVGLVMGAALGAEPLRVLLHTPAGLACLLLGGALEAVGLWWAGRIVRAGEGP
ncbi:MULTISPECIES: type II secretion system F family protein [unclassified Streptomyces]|uniref:type II secretion system F family protein n=1 Tax=unclassified Streptomyces TaxID=2593676 RepID=UPI0009A0AB79|nr:MULTISPECIES: type II secretion system F family protein [unclassified Streptomyces]